MFATAKFCRSPLTTRCPAQPLRFLPSTGQRGGIRICAPNYQPVARYTTKQAPPGPVKPKTAYPEQELKHIYEPVEKVMTKHIEKGEYQNALDYWKQWSEESGREPNVFVYNAMIKAHLGLDDLSAALVAFKQLRKIRVPYRFVYTLLLSACKKFEKPLLAKRLFEDMVELGGKPDSVAYHTLISVFAKLMDVPVVDSILKMMAEDGVPVNYVTYCIVMSMYAKIGRFVFSLKSAHTRRVDKVEALVVAMMKAGHKLDAAASHVIIDMYSSREDYESARRFFELQLAEGLAPNLDTFNRMINIYGILGLPGLATDLFPRLKKQGLIPTTITFNTLLEVYARNDDIKKAEDIFRYMKKECLDDNITYAEMIHAYARQKNPQRALDTWGELRSSGKKLTVVPYNILMSLGANLGQPAFTQAVYEQLKKDNIPPNSYTFNTLLNTYKKFNIPGMQNILQEMTNAGLEPDRVTRKILRS